MIGTGFVGFILVINLVIFLVNGVSGSFDVDVIIAGVDHVRWLLIAAVITAIVGFAHWIRMRSAALARAIISVPYPNDIQVRIDAGDTDGDGLLCRARIEVGVRDPGLEVILRKNWEKYGAYLEPALHAALNDRVIRYSKVKIEDALTRSLTQHVNPRDLAGVSLMKLSQIRAHKKSPLAGDDVDDDGFSQGLPSASGR